MIVKNPKTYSIEPGHRMGKGGEKANATSETKLMTTTFDKALSEPQSVFDRQIEAARKIMRRDRNILRELAK
jgi:hypothetical protein